QRLPLPELAVNLPTQPVQDQACRRVLLPVPTVYSPTCRYTSMELCSLFMRSVAIFALSLVSLASLASAEGITIVFDFQGPRSDGSVDEMKREFAEIMKGSSITFDWKTRA